MHHLAVGQKWVSILEPRKWNQGLKPAVPWCFHFDRYTSDLGRKLGVGPNPRRSCETSAGGAHWGQNSGSLRLASECFPLTFPRIPGCTTSRLWRKTPNQNITGKWGYQPLDKIWVLIPCPKRSAMPGKTNELVSS